MSQGTINKYFSDKGYGFIKTEEYGLCYFHISDFDTLSTEPFGNILEGDIVELEIIPSEKEVNVYEAKSVKFIGRTEKSSNLLTRNKKENRENMFGVGTKIYDKSKEEGNVRVNKKKDVYETNSFLQKAVSFNKIENKLLDDNQNNKEKYLKGVVSWYDINKGYGIVVTVTNKEVFVHHSVLASETVLNKNDNVLLSISTSKNRSGSFEAIEVIVLAAEYFIKKMNDLGEISTDEKYEQSLTLLNWNQKDDGKYLPDLSVRIYKKANEYYKMQLWIRGTINAVNKMYVLEHISFDNIDIIVKIMSRKNTELNKSIIQKLVDEIAVINSRKKYEQALTLLSWNINGDGKYLPDLALRIYRKADEYYRLQLWIGGEIKEVNAVYIWNNLNSYKTDEIVEIIAKNNDEINKKIIQKLVDKISLISNEEQYKQTRYLLKWNVTETDKRYLPNLIERIYKKADENYKRQYLEDWLNGQINDFSKQYIIENIDSYNIYMIDRIICKNDGELNKLILQRLVGGITGINTEAQYEQTKKLINWNSANFNKKFLDNLIEQIYKKAEDKFKQQYLEEWLNGQLNDFSKQYIIENIASYEPEKLERIISKKNEDLNKDILQKQMDEITEINTEEKYLHAVELLSKYLNNYDNIYLTDLVEQIHKKANEKYKFKLWIDSHTTKINEKYIWENFDNIFHDYQEKIIKYLDENDFTKIFVKLKTSQKLKVFSKIIHPLFLPIPYSTNEYVYNYLKNNIEQLNNKLKYFSNEIAKDIELLYVVKEARNSEPQFISSNSLRNKYSLIKNILESNEFTPNLINEYIQSDLHFLENIENEIECLFFYIKANEIFKKRIMNVEDLFYAIIENIEKTIKELASDLFVNKRRLIDIIIYLKHIMPNKYAQILLALQYDARMLLWLYDLNNEFNFNIYSSYYFILSTDERKIFNKKARNILSEELKISLLMKREPMVLDEIKEDDIRIYSTSLRSIWFLDKRVRFCIEQNNFTSSYPCEFAEEKFNLIFTDFSNKRLNDLKVYCKDEEVIDVTGLDDLEEIIWRIKILKEIEKNPNYLIKSDGENRIPSNLLVRKESIALLNRLQSEKHNLIQILEKTYKTDALGNRLPMGFDVSFLYSIVLDNT